MSKKGLLKKYRITKANGRGVDPAAHYFVLRLDLHGGSETDQAHVYACREAVGLYADCIEPWLPELARDLRRKYPVPGSLVGRPIAPAKDPNRHR